MRRGGLHRSKQDLCLSKFLTANTTTNTGLFHGGKGWGKVCFIRRGTRKAQRMNTSADRSGLKQMRPRPLLKVLVTDATAQPHLSAVPSINFNHSSYSRSKVLGESIMEQVEVISLILSRSLH